MFTRLIKGQLIAAAVVAVTAVVIVAMQYLHLPRLLGYGQASLVADFTDASGIYPDAIVTVRGVRAGKVTGVDATANGARLHLSVDDSIRIPTSVVASIRSTSAIGENYVELTPSADHGPFLGDGDVISAAETRPQQPVSATLSNVTALVQSVPADSSKALLDEMVTAFQGNGQNLHDIISGFDKLATAAASDARSSTEFVQGLKPFLNTQLAIDPDLQSLTRDTRSITDQLVRSDKDIRQLIHDAPPAAHQIVDLENKLSSGLPMLLDNLTSTGAVLRIQLPDLTQVMSIYPAVVAAIQSAFEETPSGMALRLRVRMTANDPPPCYTGFVPLTQQRAFEDLSRAPLQQDLFCKATPDDDRAVRGIRNTPCANNSDIRTAYFEDCLGRPRGTQPIPAGSVGMPQYIAEQFPHFGSSNAPEASEPTPAATSSATNLPQPQADFVTTYDPRSGLAFGPDGQLYQVMTGQDAAAKKELSWKILILK